MLSYGSNSTYRTQTKKDSGSSAEYEESWTFETEGTETEIKITVKDNRALMPDETLATATIKFEQYSGYHFNGDLGLIDKSHGRSPSVKLTIKCD
ncbi:C2 domain protein [Gregarina niphandrodes]|uniref:C2 domain protein n=1 Tax=Gregarina niphandrodes TaxID=110365 RepID=A0A023AXC3_GRENI|nr:C2 domain protein [Gregarina niphandrodes]EZG43252.1 C2 domain protein [Gregarina niphandrodes]|eukprot:XP_011133492.1 C2 domain protein [Gregarina niphandrodes]